MEISAKIHPTHKLQVDYDTVTLGCTLCFVTVHILDDGFSDGLQRWLNAPCAGWEKHPNILPTRIAVTLRVDDYDTETGPENDEPDPEDYDPDYGFQLQQQLA